MTSHTRGMHTLMLWSSAAAMIWLAGTAHAQELRGEALVKALQKGGYILVMRHASSPREAPDKQTANPDNRKPERQDCDRMTGYSESAGINRHVVGDARALQERK